MSPRWRFHPMRRAPPAPRAPPDALCFTRSAVLHPIRCAPPDPIGSPHMLRKLRVLAAFFMVPLVIFGTPETAAASTGPWSTVNITHSTPYVPDTYGTEIKCAFSLQQAGAGTYGMNVGTGYCIGGPDVSWGFAQDGESGSQFTISVEGISADGSGSACTGSTSSTFADHPRNGTVTIAGTITPGSLSYSAEDCDITRVCMSLRGSSPECATVDIASLVDEPEVGESCVMGVPTAYIEARKGPVNPEGYYQDQWVLKTQMPVGVSTGAWGFFVMGVKPGNVPAHGQVTSSEMVIHTVGQHTMFNAPTPTVPTGVRIQLWAYPTPGNWNKPPDATGNTFGDQNASVIATAIPTSGGPNQHYQGLTMPEHCRFYFGPKVVVLDGTEIDEPMGDGIAVPPPGEGGDPEPEPVMNPPEPTEPEPSSDLGWLAKIWAALVDIASKIAGLAKAIIAGIAQIFSGLVQAVADMLDEVFVPSDGFLETRFNSIESNWQDTSPAKYADVVQGFSFGQPAGCSGLPLELTLPGGVQVDQNIGAACSGQMSTAAYVVRQILGAVFVVSGLFACLRALGSGLGWDPGVRGGSA